MKVTLLQKMTGSIPNLLSYVRSKLVFSFKQIMPVYLFMPNLLGVTKVELLDESAAVFRAVEVTAPFFEECFP